MWSNFDDSADHKFWDGEIQIPANGKKSTMTTKQNSAWHQIKAIEPTPLILSWLEPRIYNISLKLVDYGL